MSTDSTPAFDIDKKRKVALPISLAVTVVVFLFLAGWKANDFLISIQQEQAATRRAVEALQTEFRSSASYRWTSGDMERWAYLLEKGNRDLKLTVPEVRSMRADRSGN